jgi:hypothetical protein
MLTIVDVGETDRGFVSTSLVAMPFCLIDRLPGCHLTHCKR